LIAGGYEPDRVAVLVGGIRAWHEAGYGLVQWSDPR